jgi:hypothetical protein
MPLIIGMGMGLGFGGQVSPRPWTPAELGADLALWLDAEDTASITLNGSNVSQWDDKSGNNRHATQGTASNQPAYAATGLNGKPTVENVNGDAMNFGVTTLGRNVSGITCAIVGEHPASATFASGSTEIFITTSGGAATRFALSPNYTAGGSTANRYAIGGRRLDGDAFTARSSSTDSVANSGSPWIRIGQRAYSDGVANHWTNGTQDLTAVALQGAGNTSDTDSSLGILFGGGGGSAVPNGTKLSEIVMMHSTMTSDDRQKLEGYLAWKWGLVANLPGTHPYRYTPPTTDEPAWDADALSYIGRVQNADAQALELNVRIAIDNFVKGCKADGIWDAIKASAILAGARTLDGALQPLVGSAPTNFNFISGDYNRTTGLVGDGATKYLNSNRNNNADPQDSKHVSVFVTVGETRNATRCALASSDLSSGTGTTELLSTPSARFFRINRSSDSFPVVTTASIYGLLAAERNNAANCSARFNNNTQTLSDTSSAPTANQIDIYRRGNASYSDARLAFYSIGESLDLAQLDARVTALINAYAAV